MTERETPPVDGLVIGILGGTGDQGRGLARRFALAGHQVIIGSRSAEHSAEHVVRFRLIRLVRSGATKFCYGEVKPGNPS